MKHIKYLAFVLIGVMFSCNEDDFLNPIPDSRVVVTSYFNSDEEVLAGILGVYDAIQGIPEETTSNSSLVNRGVQFEYLVTEMRSDNTRSATTEGSKADFHRYLVDANNVEVEDYYASMYEIIFRANNILDFIEVAEEGNRAAYTAESKFLRAYAYFNLVRLFGDVPMVTSVVNPTQSEALYTRVETSQIYDLIIDDLLIAVDDLNNSGSKNRASKAAAQALLAKVYLTLPNPNYIGAQQMCEAIIGTPQFTLLPDFYDVFYQELNDEIIFSVGYSSGFSEDAQGFSSEFTADAGRQDGLNIVNNNLIADFEAYGGNRTSVSYFQSPTSSDLTEVGKYLPDGYMRDEDGNYGPNPPRLAGNDWIVLRYADVLLMHVESILAGAEVTGNQAAITSFQQVRDRAGLTTPVTSITRDDLIMERRVELAFENHRFFDLVRFGIADAVLSAHASEMGYPDYTSRALLLPIPNREINLSGGLMTQNPGY
ncbi:RagB/SusD family nutrient uptake outer membrane protein [Gaetbulibacter jejuensis]|uniref:RagB/SusD family nutrient uptake outer membrane protein n=1 Tax=Gaetbulibacter jejuensis TaxID=584607 RepID=A0ABN1JI56_9FLAO